MKKILSVFIALSICFSASMIALAVESKPTAETVSTDFVILVEQTQWRYRYYENQLQKRLWSLTYEIWLTDWITC